MNLGKIFSDEQQVNEALEHFRNLKDNPDWIFLAEKLIKADITDITEAILDPEKKWKDGEEKEQKRIRAYWIILSQLPETLITALTSKEDDIFINPDPYYSDVKEILEDNKKDKSKQQ